MSNRRVFTAVVELLPKDKSWHYVRVLTELSKSELYGYAFADDIAPRFNFGVSGTLGMKMAVPVKVLKKIRQNYLN